MIELFNVTAYLDNRGIEWHSSGKNISRGWIGVNCPFCPDGDPSYHLGINLSSKWIKCWRCSKKGPVTLLIQNIERCSWSFAEQITETWQDLSLAGLYKETHHIPKGKDGKILPEEAGKDLPLKHTDYLLSRRFRPIHVAKKYDLYATGPIGDFKHRLIIPIKMNNRIVSFVGRDVTGQANIPYKDCPVERSIVPVKECLYPIDNTRNYDTAVLVEGIFDAWRIGDGAVCLFTKDASHNQLKLLQGLQRVFIMLDSDASNVSEKLAHKVSNIVPDVEILELTEGDPCDLTDTEVKNLRQDLFGK